jgi:hypothetical protein
MRADLIVKILRILCKWKVQCEVQEITGLEAFKPCWWIFESSGSAPSRLVISSRRFWGACLLLLFSSSISFSCQTGPRRRNYPKSSIIITVTIIIDNTPLFNVTMWLSGQFVLWYVFCCPQQWSLRNRFVIVVTQLAALTWQQSWSSA